MNRLLSYCSRIGLVTITLVLAAAGTVSATEANTISADDISISDAFGCTGASGGTVCGTVIGGGKHVTRVLIERTRNGPICNYRGTFTVYNSSGRTIYSRSSATRVGCFPAPYQWVQMYIDRTFSTGTRVCLSWFESDARVGTVCFRLG